MISKKQKCILAFPLTQYDALICDGAVRSGKTSLMMVSFVDWAMQRFDGQLFGICGKTVDSTIKNIIIPYMSLSYAKRRYRVKWRRVDKILEVRQGERCNRFEVFGGRDESSFALVQGRTFAGVLLDEVVLMPQSFVNQALARCSVEGAKKFFSCNPGPPRHWFKRDWIDRRKEQNALYLHFLMSDNPSLSPAVLASYDRMYGGSGLFYRRYVLGQWVAGEGAIYSMFDADNVYRDGEEPAAMRWGHRRTIAIDYGTTNPTRFLEIFDDGDIIRVHREYSWDSRQTYRQKTDAEYADDLIGFTGTLDVPIIVDPSAASFIAELRSRGFIVSEANNAVMDGIRRTSTMINDKRLLVCDSCSELLSEMEAYSWDEKAAARGDDAPAKQFDHSADALRYYINSLPDWRIERYE